jgi:hypothetical protein
MPNSKVRGSMALSAFLAATLAMTGCKSNPTDAAQPASNDSSKSGGILTKLFETTKAITVPAGTAINVVLDQSLASNQSRSGDEFEASVSAPVVIDGKTVIPKGARVHGRVVEARESGRLSHVAQLRLALRSVEVGGKTYEIETSAVSRIGANHNKRNLELIGGGTGVGALIGGIAGGGKGALIGAAAGAGAGTATAAVTGKKEIVIPAETPLRFKLVQPVTFLVKS